MKVIFLDFDGQPSILVASQPAHDCQLGSAPPNGMCPMCGSAKTRRGYKFCSKACATAHQRTPEARAAVSGRLAGRAKPPGFGAKVGAALKGKPKPWNRGANNPNFGNKAQGQPEVRERFLRATAERGQAWTEEHRRAHSERMLGDSNAMRGRKHTPEAMERIVAGKRRQVRERPGVVRRYKLSKGERSLATLFRSTGLGFTTQFHIKGEPYLYDFCFPSRKLILEYHGDYWHANPAKYAAGTMLSMQNVGSVLVDDIWARDARKRAAAEMHGYHFAQVWESDVKARGEACVLELVTSYVVLDDDRLAWIEGHTVLTNPKVGLTDADVEKAIAILGVA